MNPWRSWRPADSYGFVLQSSCGAKKRICCSIGLHAFKGSPFVFRTCDLTFSFGPNSFTNKPGIFPRTFQRTGNETSLQSASSSGVFMDFLFPRSFFLKMETPIFPRSQTPSTRGTLRSMLDLDEITEDIGLGRFQLLQPGKICLVFWGILFKNFLFFKIEGFDSFMMEVVFIVFWRSFFWRG